MRRVPPAPAPKPASPEPELSVDSILQQVNALVESWAAKNLTPDALEKHITNLLEYHQKTVFLKLMGFDKRFGSWELDHCNGRSGNSLAGDILRQKHTEAIKRFFEKHFPDDTILEFTPEETAKIQEQYRSEYNRQVEYQIRELARKDATSDLARLLSNIGEASPLLKLFLNSVPSR